MWVLEAVYQRKAPDLATAIEMLLNHKDLTLQDSDAVAAALNLFRSRLSLGFSDCLMLQLARKADTCRLAPSTAALPKSKEPAGCSALFAVGVIPLLAKPSAAKAKLGKQIP